MMFWSNSTKKELIIQEIHLGALWEKIKSWCCLKRATGAFKVLFQAHKSRFLFTLKHFNGSLMQPKNWNSEMLEYSLV